LKGANREYLKKWFPLIFKLRLIGFNVYGFDPGVAFHIEGESYPHDFAGSVLEKIIPLIDKVYPEYADNEVAYQAELKYRENKAKGD
jgi:hypothetical protein